MSSLLRFKMVDAAINHTAVEVKAPEGRPSDYFGKRVFGRAAMRKYSNKATYDALVDTMENGTPLTREVADGIAAGMRQWALEHGADPLYPLVPAPDGRYGREARCVCRSGRLGRGSGRVLRQTARSAGARCVVVPQRRHPQYVRGARLFGLGSDFAGLHRRRRRSVSRPSSSPIPARRSTTRLPLLQLDLGGEQGR